MAETERKYKGSLTLGQLELVLEAQEALFGKLIKLEALGGWTIGTYDDSDYPPLNALGLLPMIGQTAPPTPPHATHLHNGAATVLGAAIDIAVFRTH